jgi:plastocyanin
MILCTATIMGTACGGGDSTIVMSNGEKATYRGRADVADMSKVVIEMDEHFFKPTVLLGAPGQRLEVTLSNQGNQLHNFSVEGQRIDENLEPAFPVTVIVTFPQSGAVGFRCKFHLRENMRGEFATH